MDEVRILIIDDDRVAANGLRHLLCRDGFRVVGVASRSDRIEPLVREHAPGLAVVDLDRGGAGLELARDLVVAGARVVFTSAHADEPTLASARHVGAHGFVVKPYSQQQIRAAIAIALSVPGADASIPESVKELVEVAQQALTELAGVIGGRAAEERVSFRLRRDPRLASLTDRERDVVLGLLEHRRAPAIAEHLGVSAHTVRNHLKSIFTKLRVSSQQELLDQIIDRSADGRAPSLSPPTDQAGWRGRHPKANPASSRRPKSIDDTEAAPQNKLARPQR